MRFFPFVVFLLTCPSTVSAQADTSTTAEDRAAALRYMIDLPQVHRGMSDFGVWTLAPLHWTSREWQTFAVVVAITGTASLADQDVRTFALQRRSSFSGDFSTGARLFGEPVVLAPTLMTLYGIGYLSDDIRLRRMAILSAESALFSGLLTTLLKSALHRHRPNDNNGAWVWDGPFPLALDHLSFPSGHTTLAFAVATTIASEYPDVSLLPTAAYGIATLTGISRIHDDMHWLSDVVFGAAIGYYTAVLVQGIHRNDGPRISWIPYTEGTSAGIRIAITP